jgi:hypothetical protein
MRLRGYIITILALLGLLGTSCNGGPVTRVGTLLRAGSGGEWDTSIREIGNIVYERGRYYFYYSGHRGENFRGKQDIFVGVAVSEDGRHFVKRGKALLLPSEDPYVVVKDGVFYMFYEDKTEVPDRHTSLAISEDGINFHRIEFGVLAPIPEGGWQATSASSPVAILEGRDIAVLYEGYGYLPDGTKNQGQIGLYRNGSQQKKPVYTGSGQSFSYDQFVASDDVVSVGGRYFISYHALQAGVRWTAAISASSDLVHWSRPTRPQFELRLKDMTVMFFRQRDESCFRYLLSDGRSVGIYINPALSEIGLPSCTY